MNSIQADLMWDDRPEIYSKQSWSDMTDVIVLSEPEFNACASPQSQQHYDFMHTGTGNGVFGSCQSPHQPPPNHISMPSLCSSPVISSSPDLSPDPFHGYPSSFTSSPAQSAFDDIKAEAQKSNSRSSARRRDQNRAAQRAFRERREQHLKSLEGRIHSTEESYRELQQSYQRLEGLHKEAKQTIERQAIELDVFRSIVKCGYRPCDCTENGEPKPCVVKSTMKERLKFDDDKKAKEGNRSS